MITHQSGIKRQEKNAKDSLERYRNDFMLTMHLLCGNDRHWPQLAQVFDSAFSRLIATNLDNSEFRVIRRRLIDILDRLYKHGPHWEPIKSQVFATFGKEGIQKLTR